MPTYMNPLQPSWVQETAQLLRLRANIITLREIANECEVSVAWLSKLQNNKLDDPKIAMVQRVNFWLKAQKANN